MLFFRASEGGTALQPVKMNENHNHEISEVSSSIKAPLEKKNCGGLAFSRQVSLLVTAYRVG